MVGEVNDIDSFASQGLCVPYARKSEFSEEKRRTSACWWWQVCEGAVMRVLRGCPTASS